VTDVIRIVAPVFPLYREIRLNDRHVEFFPKNQVGMHLIPAVMTKRYTS